MKTPTRRALVAILALLAAAYVPAAADDSERLLTIDHYLRAQSAQAPAGAAPLLYVRERTKAGVALRGGASANRVVLFVHGAGTPAEVSFDVPYEDYSWMGYLATAGYDVFSVDLTGYGRSWRPAPMNDPCNIPANRQAEFVPALIAAPCAPSSDRHTTTMASDWSDVGVAVDYVRSLRRVTQVNLIGWSQGGPRVGGYAALHPDKVRRMVLLAPLYSRTRSADPPADVPAKGQPFTIQSRTDLVSLWDGQIGCPGQYEAGTLDAIWSEMMASDPVGATWGAGVRRAPNVTIWGWNQATVAAQQTPVLLVSGAHDKQVNPERVRELFADYGGAQKVFVDLACSSHNAMWERNHLLLFKASLEWLENGTVNGQMSGIIRMGY